MTINWGIIGTGNIARSFKEALSVVEDAKLSAVASRNINKAQDFIDHDPLIKAYGTYQDLANDPNIDVVYIATPHTFHKENTDLCLKNGKAVLCEKPFSLNAKQAKETFGIAKVNKLFIMEAMWTKFLPVIEKVKEWVKVIGEIEMVKADFGFRGEQNPSNRLYNLNLGGGGLLDIGIYPLTFATIFLGRNPLSIKSEVHIGRTKVDEQASILLRYKTGQIASLSYSFTTQLPNTAYLFGTKGRIEIPNFWMADKADLYLNQQLTETYHKPFRKNGYEYEIEEVHKCLKNNQLTSHIHSMEDTLLLLEMMDGLRNTWELKYPND